MPCGDRRPRGAKAVMFPADHPSYAEAQPRHVESVAPHATLLERWAQTPCD
jgi:hypothetical protein